MKPGDFLISCSGVTLGRITQVPRNSEKGIINQALLRVRLNSNVILDAYFLYLFRSPVFQKRKGTTYLAELKFTRVQSGAPDVDTFLAKVNDKADNTMGIMVSMSGYSSTAIEQASGRKTPIILLDHGHIYLVLSGSWTLAEVVSRVRRHASQTARSFLPASEFGT